MGKFILKRDYGGIAFVIALLTLATFANMTGWSEGAGKILTAALVLIGTIPTGTLFRETSKRN